MSEGNCSLCGRRCDPSFRLCAYCDPSGYTKEPRRPHAEANACAYAGLRVSEALGLRWRDIDVKGGTLTVAGQLGAEGEHLVITKTTSSAATVPLLPVLRRELVEHRNHQAERNFALVRPDAFVFTTGRGKPQSRRIALRALHAAGDKAGLNGEGLEPVGLHDLRHSLVAIAFEHGLTAPRSRCSPAMRTRT